jgi:diguanylate cyclase
MASDARGDDNQRSREREELIRLLCRALSRLAVAAHGVDRRLDQMLGELRQLLRRDIDDPEQLVELIDSIDARIKLVDDERDVRGDMVQRSLQQLVEQLLSLKPASALANELKSLQRALKKKPEDGEEISLLVRLPELQAQVLQGGTTTQRTGLLARWFGGNQPGNISGSSDTQPVATESESSDVTNAEPELKPPASIEISPTDIQQSALLIAQQAVEPGENGEPPFARISTAVCDVLNNLLQQIEPPPTAADNYQHACEQVSKGLNWYELVSTLEEVSLVVLAALERDQGDFQHFLLTLNQRLEQAHQALKASQIHQSERARDDAVLNTTVRGEVAQMEVQVAEATQLESLKIEVKQRLSNVVGAMDLHTSAEQQRQQQLELQLATVTDRLQEMEAHSKVIEQRLIEQQRLALLDMLTQLPNRHAYEERLEQEFERWQRYRHLLVLAVLDVDHFKSINDNYGHLAGDKVLRIIAKTLRSRLRKTDFIGRFGGEEFVVLMPETSLDAALKTLQSMCAAVAECPFHFRAQPVSITLSGGVAEFVVGVPADTIFERADAALYRAKAAGRNQCIVAQP